MLLGSCFCEASKIVTSQVLVGSVSVFEGLYYNSMQTLCVGVVLSASLEWQTLGNLDWSSGTVCGLVAANMVLSAITIMSALWVVQLVGGLSLGLLVTLRNIVLVLVSVTFFSEYLSPSQYIGYTVALLFMGMFDHLKSSRQDATEKAEAGTKNEQEDHSPWNPCVESLSTAKPS